MYLDAVENNMTSYEQSTFTGGNASVFEKWSDWHPSQISHHGRICCEIAREWLTGTDRSELGSASVLSGPRWLRQKFKWGPSSFPIYWCEAVRKKTLDCGALAALAEEIYKNRGVRVLRAQMVQRFSDVATSQWSCSWNDGETLAWTNRDLIYHEGCAVVIRPGEVKIWDASAGWWTDPRSNDGYGSLLALRIAGGPYRPGEMFNWGGNRLVAGAWTELLQGLKIVPKKENSVRGAKKVKNVRHLTVAGAPAP